jgi:hypothetical protein
LVKANTESLCDQLATILFCLRVKTQTAFEIQGGFSDRCLPQSHRIHVVLRNSQIQHIQKMDSACHHHERTLPFSRQVSFSNSDDLQSRAPSPAL